MNNRLTSSSAQYDLNGNLTSYTGGGTFVYDIENRITSSTSTSGGAAYSYDSANQRVYKAKVTGSTFSNEEVYLYGIDGKKLETVSITWSGSVPMATLKSVNQWFGGRLLKPQDRLASIGKYFPYGEDRYTPTPANPANGTEKFATYTRDAETGLDYAYQRYYAAGLGRFTAGDPFGGSAQMGDPQSFNPYAYVQADPVNHIDPSGLDYIIPGGGSFNPGDPRNVNPNDTGVNVYGEAPRVDISEGNMIPRGLHRPNISFRRGPDFESRLTHRCFVPILPGKNGRETIKEMIDAVNKFIADQLSNQDPEIAANWPAALVGVLTASFMEGGQWDYKNGFEEGTKHDAAKEFGNFAFGAVMQSIGMSYYLAQNAAGVAQVAISIKGGDKGEGLPLLQYPFGDQTNDAMQVRRGFYYMKTFQAGNCPSR